MNQRISKTKSFFEAYDYTILPRNSYIPFNPNPHFTGRHRDILELYLKMIGNLNKIGINQVGTIGMGGIGKTQLAVEFAYRFSYAFHAVYWIQAANPDTWLREFTFLTKDRLRREISDVDKLEGDRAYLSALQEYFKDHPNTLVIMDNVTEPKLLNNDTYLFGFTPLTLGCDLLFTTRRHLQLPGVASQTVNVLSAEAAYDLLTAYRAPETPDDKNYARAICSAVGFLPLAITLAGAYLSYYDSDITFADYHEELVKKRLDVVDIGEMSEEELATRHMAAVRATLEDQWRMLKDEGARQLLQLAGQFAEAAIIPKARLGLLAGITPGRSKIDQPLAKAFNHLHSLCMVEPLEGDTSAARLHPLVREFSNQLVPAAEQVAFRIAAARRLRTALFDFRRLEAEVRKRGFEEVIIDLETGVDWWGIDGDSSKEELKVLLRTLRLSAHVLARDPDQLASQLLGRLQGLWETGEMSRLLEQAKGWRDRPWFRPVSGSLTTPGGALTLTLTGHKDTINHLAALPDGRRVLSSDHSTLRLWNIDNGRCEFVFSPHTKNADSSLLESKSRVNYIEISADGHQALTTAYYESTIFDSFDDVTLCVWDLDNVQLLRAFIGHKYPITAAAFLPDGRHILSASAREHTLRLWDINSSECLRTFADLEINITKITVLPDGHQALLLSGDGQLALWNLDNGERIRIMRGLTINQIELLPDGHRALSAEGDTMTLWNLSSGECLRTFTVEPGIDHLAVLPDGCRAVSASNGNILWADRQYRRDQTLRLWALDSGECLQFSGRPKYDTISNLAVLPTGARAVSASEDGTLRLWDLEEGKCLQTIPAHPNRITQVAVLPDGDRVLTASVDRTVRLWNLAPSNFTRAPAGHAAEVTGVVVLPDGGRALSTSTDRTVRLWHLESGEYLGDLRIHEKGVDKVNLLPGGRRALCICGDTLCLLDLQSCQVIKSFANGGGAIDHLAVTPDGRRALAANSNSRTLRLWDIESGECVQVKSFYVWKEGIHRPSGQLVPLPDGHRALFAPQDGTENLWDLDSGELVRGLDVVTYSGGSPMRLGRVCRMLPLPDGSRILFATEDSRLVLWDLDRRMWLHTIRGHEAWINQIVLLPDGHHALTASDDCTLRLWDLDGGECKRIFTGHEGGVTHVAVLGEGHRALSASVDHTLRLWDLETGTMIANFTGDSMMTALTATPDGQTFVAGEFSGRVHILKLEDSPPVGL